jgi:hypothetical protein
MNSAHSHDGSRSSPMQWSRLRPSPNTKAPSPYGGRMQRNASPAPMVRRVALALSLLSLLSFGELAAAQDSVYVRPTQATLGGLNYPERAMDPENGDEPLTYATASRAQRAGRDQRQSRQNGATSRASLGRDSCTRIGVDMPPARSCGATKQVSSCRSTTRSTGQSRAFCGTSGSILTQSLTRARQIPPPAHSREMRHLSHFRSANSQTPSIKGPLGANDRWM